jgi:hypothetical protein
MRTTTDVTGQIQQLLAERQRHTDVLDAINQTLGQIGALLSGGTNGSKPERSGKAKGESGRMSVVASRLDIGAPVTLADHLEAIMRKAAKPASIADLTAGVKAAGYRSKSKDFRPVVSLALINDKRFKRVDRGVYTLR